MTNNSNEPFVKINGAVYTKSQIEKMSPIQITDILNQIPVAIDSCNNVITSERRGKNDKRKIASTMFAKKQLQNALNWVSVIRKKKNVEYNNSVNENFREAAKQVLSEEDFEAVKLRAQAITELKAKEII